MSAQPADQPLDVNALLDVLADYADQQAELDRQAYRNTLAIALAVQELYESKVWVPQWLEQKPPPKVLTSRWNPESVNRFQQWQAWSNEQRGRRPMGSKTTYRMVNVARVFDAIPNSQFVTDKLGEAAPFIALDWMRRNGYLDRIPDVWRIAVQMAGSVDRVTQEHTKAALVQWKHDYLGSRVSRVARNSGMEAQRLKAQGAFDELLYRATRAENGREELQKYLDHVKAQLAERRK